MLHLLFFPYFVAAGPVLDYWWLLAAMLAYNAREIPVVATRVESTNKTMARNTPPGISTNPNDTMPPIIPDKAIILPILPTLD